MRKPGIVTLVRRAIEKETKFLANLQGADNPQLVAMRLKSQGALEAYEAVLDALRGDNTLLRVCGDN